MTDKRNPFSLPEAVDGWGWKFHHVGIPTDKKLPGEVFLEHLGFYVCGFDTSPFGVEWMRFLPGSEVHPLVKTVPHLAFVVHNLEDEIKRRGLRVLGQVSQPSDGIRVAMIEHDGAPIELMEFLK